MATVLLEDHAQIEIPTIRNLEEFRRWALSDEFPQRGRIDYIGGRIEVDMSPEDFFTHGTLKAAISSEIYDRVEELDLGHTLIAETRISDVPADLSAEPDVVVISYQSFDEGRARLVPKASREADRYVEVEGCPDLIVEIVSDSSVQKDTQRLPIAYYQAGVREYWLIDARSSDEISFQILRRGADAFEPTPPMSDRHQRSSVLDRFYLLERSRHQRGHWVYDLKSR